MADKPTQGAQRPLGGQPQEQRGVVQDVIVSVVGSAAGPALAKGVGNIVKKDK
jgi:hypothetical protein